MTTETAASGGVGLGRGGRMSRQRKRDAGARLLRGGGVSRAAAAAAAGGGVLRRGGRMSRQRKRDAVLRLLRGEDLETLSRALGVTAATLSGWQEAFLAAGEE